MNLEAREDESNGLSREKEEIWQLHKIANLPKKRRRSSGLLLIQWSSLDVHSLKNSELFCALGVLVTVVKLQDLREIHWKLGS